VSFWGGLCCSLPWLRWMLELLFLSKVEGEWDPSEVGVRVTCGRYHILLCMRWMTWVYEGTTYKNKYLDLWKFDVFFFLHMFYNGTVFKKGYQIFQRIFGRSKIFFFLHMFYEGIL
jgi:hypothetical protein